MLVRIVSILFPMLIIVVAGFFYARRHKPDMTFANQLNMDVFVPALVLAALADKSFRIQDYLPLALAVAAMVLVSGLAALPLARLLKVDTKTFAPPLMFNNCGNLGLPLAVLAFGEGALPAAVVMFLVSNLMHFSLGAYILDHRTRLANIWRIPVVLASVVGLAISLSGIVLWQPLWTGIKLLGDVSVPLLLFSLGVRLTDSSMQSWNVGIAGAVARPVIGMSITAFLAWVLALPYEQSALLIVFGALPPAVLNYVFAERYRQEPDKVASIVLLGNVAAIGFLPLALGIVLR